MIFAVDAGSTVSSWVLFDTAAQTIFDKELDMPNAELLAIIGIASYNVFAFEQLAPFGFVVGKEVFDTIEWNGRFRHAAEIRAVTVFPVKRKQCVVHHTGSAKGGDSAIRTAMLARFGKEKTEGVTYDLWQALSVAAFAADHMNNLSGGAERLAGAKPDSQRRSAPEIRGGVLTPKSLDGGVPVSVGMVLPQVSTESGSSAPPAQSILPVPCAGRLNDSVCDAAEDRTARESTSTPSPDYVVPAAGAVNQRRDSRGGQKTLSGGLNAGSGVPVSTKAHQPAQFISKQVSATSPRVTRAEALAQAKRLMAIKPKPRPLPPNFRAHLDCVGTAGGKSSAETLHPE